jgi:hypothetical protein
LGSLLTPCFLLNVLCIFVGTLLFQNFSDIPFPALAIPFPALFIPFPALAVKGALLPSASPPPPGQPGGAHDKYILISQTSLRLFVYGK